MLLSNLFCSHLMMIGWLQNYLIPCPFKKLTGFDCPGCGFQRSVIALANGDVNHSLVLYPAAIPIILLLIVIASSRIYLHRDFNKAKRVLMIISAVLITGAYLFKIAGYFTH